jgi:hypothetical protein
MKGISNFKKKKKNIEINFIKKSKKNQNKNLIIDEFSSGL